jgi:hypothetical protein
MNPLIASGLYGLAAFIPAYLTVRKSSNIWRNISGWLIGFFGEFVAITGIFLYVTSANLDASPLAVALTLFPSLAVLLIIPCVGLAAGNLVRYLRLR